MCFIPPSAILVFDPSVGSVHPLASSRIHSRTNSAPGRDHSVGGTTTTRTPTDERTTAKSSLPTTSGAGSQSQGRRRNAEGRRRAKSEDFLLGSILLEQQSNGRTEPNADSKDGGSSNSSSVDEDIVVPGDSNVGGTRSRSLSRRKGRSAEELQARSVHGGEVALTKGASASLDPLSGDSQARSRRRNHRNGNKRISASVDQLNYIRTRTDDVRTDDDVRIDDVRARLQNSEDADPDERRSGRQEQTVQGQTYQGEGHQGHQGHQGQTVDEVFDEDISVSSAESISAPPLPRSKASRTRNISEDSYVQEPRTNNRYDDNHVPEPLRSNRTQVPQTDNADPRHRNQNAPQTTRSSPLPNYHIHINIQSPQSPPTEPGHSKDLAVHSLVRGTTAVQPTSRSPPPQGFKDDYGGSPGMLQLGSVARSSQHRVAPVGDGISAPIGVRSDQHHGRSGRRQVYSSGGTLPTRHTNLQTVSNFVNYYALIFFISSLQHPLI